MILPVTVLIPFFLAQSTAPSGTQTPCEWLIAEREAGRSLPDLVALAEAQQSLFTNKDLRCLQQAGFHKRVVQAARGTTALEAMATAAAAAADAAAEQQAAAEKAKQAAETEALQNRYDVELLAVWIAPAKSNGSAWDGLDQPVSPEVVAGALALASQGAGVALAEAAGLTDLTTFLANNALQGASAPDIFGYAEIRGPHAPKEWAGVKVSLRPPDDAAEGYYANFPGSPGFHGVKLEHGDVLRVTLYDADLTEHDPIGVFDVTADDVLAASQLSGSAVLRLGDRGAGQVLMCQFAAYPASTPTASIVGRAFR